MIVRIIIDICLALGTFFALAGTIGVNFMPDTFSRMQASTCITTLGVVCLGLGAVLYELLWLPTPNYAAAVKIFVIGALVVTVNPVGAHAIMKGAYRSGIRPDKAMKTDDFRRDFDE